MDDTVSPLSQEELIAELRRRLVEDEQYPNDTFSWESIRADAIARWGIPKQPSPRT